MGIWRQGEDLVDVLHLDSRWRPRASCGNLADRILDRGSDRHGSNQSLVDSIYTSTNYCRSMCFGFFVKMAQFGVHVWLPYAHAEAPTPVSALLSPAMIGIGGYAVVRIVMTIFPEAFLTLSAFFAALAVVTMFYGAAMALVQDDIKRLLAYSSVSQMGYILFGLAASDSFGVAVQCSNTSVMELRRVFSSWLQAR